MKKYFFVATMALFTIALSCTKNNTPSKTVKAETPAQALINNNFLDSTNIFAHGPHELGYRFYSSKNGRITKIGCYVPRNLPYRVTLWDSATKQILALATIPVTDSTKFTYKDILPINIEANKKYIISINNFIDGVNKQRFQLTRKAPNVLSFPINIGTITILHGMYTGCSTTCFPEYNDNETFLTGFPDFVIEYTE